MKQVIVEDRRSGYERRLLDRRQGLNSSYAEHERRSGFDRRVCIRREEDRAKGRRRGFFKEKQRQRVEEAMDQRLQLKKDKMLYSPQRVAQARKEGLRAAQMKRQEAFYDKERLARSLALTYGLNINKPAAEHISTWHQEYKNIKDSIKNPEAYQKDIATNSTKKRKLT